MNNRKTIKDFHKILAHQQKMCTEISFRSLINYVAWLGVGVERYVEHNFETYRNNAKEKLKIAKANGNTKVENDLSYKIQNYNFYDWVINDWKRSNYATTDFIVAYSTSELINFKQVLDFCFKIKADFKVLPSSKHLLKYTLNQLPYIHDFSDLGRTWPSNFRRDLPIVVIPEFATHELPNFFNLISYCLIAYDKKFQFAWVPERYMNTLGKSEYLEKLILNLILRLSGKQAAQYVKIDLKENYGNFKVLASIASTFFLLRSYGFLLAGRQKTFNFKSTVIEDDLNADRFSFFLLKSYCVENKIDITILVLSLSASVFYLKLVQSLVCTAKDRLRFDEIRLEHFIFLIASLGQEQVQTFKAVYNKLRLLFNPAMEEGFKVQIPII